MPQKVKLGAPQIHQARTLLQKNPSVSAAASALGVHRSTLVRALARVPVRPEAPKRKSGAFPQPPRRTNGNYAWDLAAIRHARDAQMLGQFKMAVRLSEGMRTDDALFVARFNRIAPARAIANSFTPYDSDIGKKIASKAKRSITIEKHTLESIAGTLVDHGIAIGIIRQTPNDKGTCVDFRLEEWPLEFVRWNPTYEWLETQTEDMQILPITHGDGTWVLFRKFGLQPWKQDAAILPGALLWAAHAESVQWWASSAKAHGLSKIIGQMPEGIPLRDDTDEGGLSEELSWYLRMLTDIASGEAVAGVSPANTKIDFISNGSNAWQVFKELTTNREKAAMRIYCGTDAALGSVGGAPGVDIAALFGVSTTRIQGDFDAIALAINTGVVAPWVLTNYGDAYESRAPVWAFEFADIDSTAKADEQERNLTRLLDAVKRLRDERFDVSQDVVDSLAHRFNVIPVPMLAISDTPKSQLVLAPTDIAKAVTVNEARASQGLPPDLDPVRGALTLSEVDIVAEGEAEEDVVETEADAETDGEV